MVSYCDIDDCFSDRFDDSGALVSKDDWAILGHWPISVKHMEIRVTHSAGHHSYQHFTALGCA
ncbi:hypothetical protein TUM20984_44510 [Mycobacterium antarcticum]|nr:hypothetical protein TUM20984_44510 [Mycolicibacterium sp. TUM20984]